jgi:hypothetical protein
MTSRTRRVVARAGIWLLRPGSACSGRDLLAPAQDLFATAGESPAQRGIPSAPQARRSLRGRSSRAVPGAVCSAVHPARSGRAPAPSPLASFAPRVVRQLRQPPRLLGCRAALAGGDDAGGGNSSAGFRNRNAGSDARPVRSALDPLAPGSDSTSRELIRCLPNPIRRLRRRIRRLPRSIRRLAAPLRRR